MHPRTRLVYFYFLRLELLLKIWSRGGRDQVRLPCQRHICRSKYGCFCLSPKVTYLHTKIEGGVKIFISIFASLSWRIALKLMTPQVVQRARPLSTRICVTRMKRVKSFVQRRLRCRCRCGFLKVPNFFRPRTCYPHSPAFSSPHPQLACSQATVTTGSLY